MSSYDEDRFEFVLNKYMPKNASKLPTDIQYLLDDKIGLVLSEGLNVLYKTQPKHPIDFFAKWLLNYEATQNSKKAAHDAQEKHKDQIKKYDDAADIRKKQEAQVEEQRKAVEKFEAQFREKLKNYDYHEELLSNELPSFIEKLKGLPATYIGMLEHPSRAIYDDEEEEFAHLDYSQPKVITYVGASGTQKFVLGRELQPGTGVTYSVFQQNQPEVPQEEGQEVPKSTWPGYLYIPDVIKEPKIVFFRIPKLGAYMACPLIYRSVLSEKTFDEGVKERLRVRDERERIRKEKVERDEDFTQRIKDAQEQGEETQAIEDEWKNYEAPEVEEREFDSEEKKFVLCVDTLGEDRELTDNEKTYVHELTQTFVKCWEESEKKQLSNDIDLYIQGRDTVNKDEFMGDIEEKLNAEIKEKYQEEEGEEVAAEATSEAKENYKKAVITAEFYRARLMQDDVKNMIKALTKYRVIKFKSLIQNIMYFLGYKKGQVNVPGTNMLEWKEVKKLIAREDFFTKLEEFEFRGPKEGYWEKYALVNRLLQKFEKIKVEELEDYNLGLTVLYLFIKQALETRVLDIQLRRSQQEEQKKKREELIQEAETWKETRARELEEAQAKATQEEVEFNQEEWEAKWDEENPAVVIPDEVVDDIDEDIEA